ncbi:protein kinase [bacterium]|nr:protein kinase [bacterium]
MIGTTLSHYSIEAELGRGGMGIVYKARDTKLNREVALKVLPSAALATDDDRARFYREAQAAAQLHHPNIATIFEIDEAVPSDAPHGTQPSPFIVMEYIEGETLDARIRKGPMKLSEAVRIALEMASALDLAHSKNIVHRDVKSANVMLTAKDSAKVLDFGLAKTAQSTQLTRMGSTLGTVAYMSPEQARGEEVDHRTDLWALGVVLYEMIAGRGPFGGDYEQAVVYSILNSDLEPLTALRSGVPMELERITFKLLAKEAGRRYQTAADLIADLSGVDTTSASHSSIRTSTIAPVAATQPEPAKPSLAWWAGAAMCALLLAAMVWWLKPSPNVPSEETRTYTLDFPDMPVPRILAASSSGKWLVLDSGAEDNRERVWLHDLESGETVRKLDVEYTRHIRLEFSEDEQWILKSASSPVAPAITRIRVDNGFEETLAMGMDADWISPDRILYLFGDATQVERFEETDFSLVEKNLETSKTRGVLTTDSAMARPVYIHADVLPDRVLALVTVLDVEVPFAVPFVGLVDLEASSIEVLIPGASYARYIETGHIVYMQGSYESEVMIRPFDMDSRTWTGGAESVGIGTGTWFWQMVTSSGDLVYMRNDPPSYYWLDPESKAVEPIDMDASPLTGSSTGEPPELVNRRNMTPSFSPDGSLVSITQRVGGGPHVAVVDLETGIQRVLAREYGPSGSPTWSPDSKWVYYTAGRAGKWVIARRPADLSLPEETFYVGDGALSQPVISPDGRWMGLNQGGTAVLVSMADTTNQVSIEDTWGDIGFSTDSRFVAISEPNQGIRVRNLDTGNEFSARSETEFRWAPQWSADGKYLYYLTPRELKRIPVSINQGIQTGTEELVARFSGHFQYALHPDGRVLILGAPLYDGSEVTLIKNVAGRHSQ